MTAGNRQRRQAAGKAADGRPLSGRRSLSGCIPALFALFGCLLSSAWAAQASHAALAPHIAAAPHALIAKPSASHPASSQQPQPQRPAPPRTFAPPRAVVQPRTVAPTPAQAPSIGHNAVNTLVPSYGTARAQATLPQRPFTPARPAQGNNQPNGEHLGSWMNQHQNQSPADQERALRQEPGFNRLAPQQQQNLVNHLHQLNQMQPEQRARTLARIENMEHLSPDRRQAVRSSAQQLGDLPQDRKRMVQKAFRDLRDMPPEQRQAVMNSPQFSGQFSAQERSIMGNLLTVEPYQHTGPSAPQPQYGK